MPSLSTTATTAWIFGARPNPQARFRLFCFPYAGGGASIYRTWLNGLQAEVEVLPVQLPGRENRLKESPFDRFESLLEALVEALHPFCTVPFAFFGHSMGALVSFELARWLRRQYSLLPVHLFASAYRAPQTPIVGPLLHTLPEPALVQKLLQLNGTSREVLENDELRQFLLPILRADFAVCETYHYEPQEPLACPITVFGGLQDTRVSRFELALWREQTCSRFSQRMLPGDHFFLQSARASLLQIIRQELNAYLIS
ncbi:MAG TPA: thioesterase II family protein [Ktedonobacteraceae bacterium]|jgi:medium-chain acyl-[acyl-carrier-protein] hydrolase|nr:thioesterase II family protein [Ktedonobacteraceae bacterium]